MQGVPNRVKNSVEWGDKPQTSKQQPMQHIQGDLTSAVNLEEFLNWKITQQWQFVILIPRFFTSILFWWLISFSPVLYSGDWLLFHTHFTLVNDFFFTSTLLWWLITFSQVFYSGDWLLFHKYFTLVIDYFFTSTILRWLISFSPVLYSADWFLFH